MKLKGKLLYPIPQEGIFKALSSGEKKRWEISFLQ